MHTYNPDYKSVWDAFVSTAKNATFLFYRDFVEYHKHRFDDFSLLVFNNNKLIALFPANRVNNEVFSHQGLSYGGLLLKKDVSFQESLLCFKAVLTFLYRNKIDAVNIKLLPKIYHKLPSDEIDYLLFLTKAKLYRTDITTCIQMSNRLKITSKNRLRGIKRAYKQKLQIVEEPNFGPFWSNILIPNLKEKHNVNPVHNIAEIEFLHKNFPNNIRQFNVYKGAELVAGSTIFETATVAHAQYISANNSKQKLGGLDMLFNYLIGTVFKHKLYFDFGISNVINGKHVNLGLINWKESYGAQSVAHQFYKVETKSYTMLNEVFV